MQITFPAALKQPARTVMHAACLLPLAILLGQAFTHNLTANPIQAVEQRTGLTALIILTVMLAFSPLAAITHELYWRSFRKPVGLYAFLYASLHLLTFAILDFNLNWIRLAGQLTEKPFILLGLAAFVLLASLAATSFKGIKKRMGKNWKRLHRMVYLIAVLVVIHDALSQKANPLMLRGNILQPALLAGIILILLALRIPVIKKVLHLR